MAIRGIRPTDDRSESLPQPQFNSLYKGIPGPDNTDQVVPGGTVMSISDKDRTDHKKGDKARKDDFIGQALRSTIQTQPDSEAYKKGLRGERLDADKKNR
jgi:hypothetical protein